MGNECVTGRDRHSALQPHRFHKEELYPSSVFYICELRTSFVAELFTPKIFAAVNEFMRARVRFLWVRHCKDKLQCVRMNKKFSKEGKCESSISR